MVDLRKGSEEAMTEPRLVLDRIITLPTCEQLPERWKRRLKRAHYNEASRDRFWWSWNRTFLRRLCPRLYELDRFPQGFFWKFWGLNGDHLMVGYFKTIGRKSTLRYVQMSKFPGRWPSVTYQRDEEESADD